MAAHLRKDPTLTVELVEGRYGEFTVLLDGTVALDAGALAFLGIVPSIRRVEDVIASRRAGGAG